MRFERIRLENFKCYADADLRLDQGVTVIHGLNGSGKSSLLEACFFALYGSRSLEKTLEDVVTIGAEDATIELWFAHGGGSYHVERRLRVTEERATTAKCVLETPDGVYEGARAVREHVTELLRMDAEAFVNCAYVRQGEVNKLINATPGERQDMIDDLLQLGKLEDYRERASQARLGVKHVRDGKAELLEELETQVGRKEDRDLHAQLNELQTRLADLDEQLENYEAQRENAVATRDEAASIIEEYDEKRERLATLREEIEDLSETIEATERERSELQERIRELRDERDAVVAERTELLAETDLDDDVDREAVAERIEALRAEDDELRSAIEQHRLQAQEHTSEAESAREAADDLDDRAAEARERADDLSESLAEARETIAQRREKIESIDERLAERRAAFADAPIDADEADEHWDGVADDLNDQRERETELETTLENERAALREAEELLEAGKCPECGQPVEDSPHVDSIEDDRERVAELENELVSVRERRQDLEEELDRAEELVELADEIEQLRTNRENVEQLLEEQSSGLDEREAEIESLREDAAEYETEAEQKREAAAEAEAVAADVRQDIAECNEQLSEIRGAIEQLTAVEDTFERESDLVDEIERLRETRSNKAELNDERRERLADKRDRRADLEEEFDESAVEQAREEKRRAEAYLEKVEPKLEELRAERDDLTGRIGGVKQEIEALEGIRERRDDLAETVANLESLYEEAEQLQDMYGTLRAELRQRNVESLERMLNETFELVYQNDSYSRIELDGEYELTVYQKDGDALDPEQLSGGERALFNLSLRCAIYRLLAEGIEGSAPMPPLILDEPTVFLDSGHVSKLVELVDTMRELGVEQIVVVSHDEELVGAADDLVTVRKDATTNRSTVEREEGVPDALLSTAD
ncbi:MAG: DNA double-strand break repair ATPase Rad50 [Haloarculaceae archaeon]